MITNIKNQPIRENVVSNILAKYLPFWPLFLFMVLLGLIFGWVFLNFSTPIYEAHASLIIKDNNKGVDDANLLKSMNFFDSKKIVENEINVLRSNSIIEMVVDSLNLNAPVFEKGTSKDFLIYGKAPITIAVKQTKLILESENIPFSYDSNEKLVKIDGNQYSLNSWQDTPFGVFKFKENKDYIHKSGNELYFKVIGDRVIENIILDNLNIIAVNKLSSVVELTYKDADPKRAEDILDHIIKSYGELSDSEKRKLAINTLSFVDERLHSVGRELDSLEYQIQRFRFDEDVVDLSTQGKIYLQNVGDTDLKLADINLQLAVLNRVEEYVASKEGGSGMVPSTLGVEDVFLSELLQTLYEKELEYERLKKTVAINNPMLSSLTDEIDKIRPSILENVRSRKENLKASIRNLNTSNSKYSSSLKKLPQKERGLLEISRRLTTLKELHSFLLNKREEVELSYVPDGGEFRVINNANASIKPISPKPFLVYAGTISLFFFLALGSIYAREALSLKLLFKSEIENITSTPIVSELSHVSKIQNGYRFTELHDWEISEQFRDLSVSLGLFSNKVHDKIIMITSGIEGEGKTLVSINLSRSLAKTKRRVLLIDFDLRSPSCSKFFGLTNKMGLVEYLSGEVNLTEIIHSSSVSNLSIIPSGQELIKDSHLLVNEFVPQLFESLKSDYDYIIIDTPPIDLVSDAHLLSEYSDTTLIVTRHNYTPKKLLKRLIKSNRNTFLKKPKIVFNGVKKRGVFVKKRNSYGYGYEN